MTIDDLCTNPGNACGGGRHQLDCAVMDVPREARAEIAQLRESLARVTAERDAMARTEQLPHELSLERERNEILQARVSALTAERDEALHQLSLCEIVRKGNANQGQDR